MPFVRLCSVALNGRGRMIISSEDNLFSLVACLLDVDALVGVSYATALKVEVFSSLLNAYDLNGIVVGTLKEGDLVGSCRD